MISYTIEARTLLKAQTFWTTYQLLMSKVLLCCEVGLSLPEIPEKQVPRDYATMLDLVCFGTCPLSVLRHLGHSQDSRAHQNRELGGNWIERFPLLQAWPVVAMAT